MAFSAAPDANVLWPFSLGVRRAAYERVLCAADARADRPGYGEAVRFAAVGERLRRIPAFVVDVALATAVAGANGFAIGEEQEAGAKEPGGPPDWLGLAI